MNISGVSSTFWPTQSTAQSQARQNLPGNFSSTTGSNASVASSGDSSSDAWPLPNSDESVAQQFMDYASENPIQRMESTWFAQHNITEQQFDAMTTAQKQQVIDEMKQDIQTKLKQEVNNANKSSTNILV